MQRSAAALISRFEVGSSGNQVFNDGGATE